MERTKIRLQFLQQFFGEDVFDVTPVTGDASFRQYFRVRSNDRSWVLMDSDPARVDNHPFLALNQVFSDQGLVLPKIILHDEANGFFLLSDLGSTHLADLLADEASRELHYRTLIDLMLVVAQTPPAPEMKQYDDAFVETELAIFKDWLVEGWLKQTMSETNQQVWRDACVLLTDNVRRQPRVTVHRDYHSRNLMHTGSNWALIDYQDAVQGPVSYDLVSLLRDCYFRLPNNEFNALFDYGFERFNQAGLLGGADKATFTRWFDLMGIQRHLKAAGIFCRLMLRDNKAGYLPNLLPTLSYVTEVAVRYDELKPLSGWLEQSIVPAVIGRLSQ